MATVLGHEAYRDGIVTNDNDLETQAAVLAHTKMAVAMILGGQDINLNGNLIDDLMAYVDSGGGGGSFNAYVNGNYDSSADYWKLISKSDGNNVLLPDGSKDYSIEYYDLNEEGSWEIIGRDKIIMTSSASVGQSLFQILGEKRIGELIVDPIYLASIKGQANYQELAGNYVMEKTGWFSLTANKPDGYILANLTDGMVENFTVSATLYRNWDSWDGALGNGQAVTKANNKGLDTMVFRKRDLDGKYLDTFTLGKVQSVDVYTDMDQPYHSYSLEKDIQGNTIVSDFSLRVLSTTNDKAMVIHNAMTLDGDWVNKAGYDNDPGGRWLIHGGTTFQTSDGCFIPSNEMLKMLNETMSKWGVRSGHEIKGSLTDYRGQQITAYEKEIRTRRYH
jgi:hypothetical protein